jgi:plasmid maintenance system antidote protein VapI
MRVRSERMKVGEKELLALALRSLGWDLGRVAWVLGVSRRTASAYACRAKRALTERAG